MAENEEVKNEEVVEDVVEETNAEEVPSEETEKVEERPEKNWKAELERKNKEIEHLRQAAETARHNTTSKRDQNDLTTWSDAELKAVAKSNDPAVIPFKDQVEDIILERKVQSMREKERMQEKRALSELTLKAEYPDSVDPSSALSLKMEQVMHEYDLQKSPAGRLAAAKIASAELGKGRSKSNAKERDSENRRVADVKKQMVDGDRPKSTKSESPEKAKNIEARLRSRDINTQVSAFNDVLKGAGIDRDNFFKR